MKKKIITAIMIFTISLSAISFSWLDVKALTQQRLQGTHTEYYDNVAVMQWETSAFITSSSSTEYINLELYGWVGPVAIYRTAGIVSVGLTDKFSGSVVFTFNDLRNYNYCEVVGDGVGPVLYSQAGGTVRVTFTDCNSFQIHLASATQQSSPTCTVSSVTIDTLTVAQSSFSGSVDSYEIPIISYAAYMFSTLKTTVLFDDGDIYPYVYIDSSNNETKYTKNIYVPRYGMNPVDFFFYADSSFDWSTSWQKTSSSSSNLEVVISKVSELNVNFTLYKMSFSNLSSGTSGVNGTIEWINSFYMIPVFIGNENTCPESLSGLLGYRGNLMSIYHEIDLIYQLLSNSSDVIDPSIEDQSQAWDDLIDQEDQVVSDFNSDLDDFQQNVDLDDYDFISGLQNTSSYFQLLLDDVFNKSAQIRAMWVIPVICVVILALLGSR